MGWIKNLTGSIFAPAAAGAGAVGAGAFALNKVAGDAMEWIQNPQNLQAAAIIGGGAFLGGMLGRGLLGTGIGLALALGIVANMALKNSNWRADPTQTADASATVAAPGAQPS